MVSGSSYPASDCPDHAGQLVGDTGREAPQLYPRRVGAVDETLRADTGAILTDATLTGADLSFANLTRANLMNANLTDATLCTTTMPDGSVDNSGCS